MPQDYYKVTGKHYFRKLPDADLRLIVAGLVLFLSVLLPVVQYQRYSTAIKYLMTATVNNLSLRSGGSKQTVELFLRASDEYEAHLRAGIRDSPFQRCVFVLTGLFVSLAAGSKFDKSSLRIGKMQKDPIFIDIVKKVRICFILTTVLLF